MCWFRIYNDSKEYIIYFVSLKVTFYITSFLDDINKWLINIYLTGDISIMQIQKLSNNSYIAWDIFEIISFPELNISKEKDVQERLSINREFFEQLLEEFHKFAFDSNTVIELLWKTDKAYNQAFKSKIRLFCIIRRLGMNRVKLEKEALHIYEDIFYSVSAKRFNVQKTEEYSFVFGEIPKQAYSIIKREKYNASTNSLYPYYYTDIIPINVNNMSDLAVAMSQFENCAISIQLFPTHITPRESCILNEMTSQLYQINNGIMFAHQMYRDVTALEPYKVISYYNEKKQGALFQYNIVIMGQQEFCMNLTAKLIGFIKSGRNSIGNPLFECINVTRELKNYINDFPIYPWNLNNKLLYEYRNKNVQQNIPMAKELFRLPYLVTATEASALFRLPLYEKGIGAIKSNKSVESIEQFDESVVGDNNISFGKLVVNEYSGINIGCSEKAFTKHALIVGVPGSGKTTFSVKLLLQFHDIGIPFLAIEPTKTEYRAMIDAIPNLQIFTPGNNGISPFIINPFIPPKHIKVEQYIPSLASAFNAAFSMPEPLDMIFFKAIRTCYTEFGWKDYSTSDDPDVKIFGLYDFILTFKKLVKKMKYGQEVKGNIESGGLLRLSNLIEQNANIYDTIHTVPIEDLLSKPTVLELNAIDNAEQKSLIMALLLINICVYTKHNMVADGSLKNIILIDEAHVLLGGENKNNKGADAKASTVKALQDMIAEIRSYGTGIIIADQSPSKVGREVIANTDIKVAFRLVHSDEKQLIGDSMGMNEYAIQRLAGLKTGEAFVFYNKLETPQLILTDDIREEKSIRLSVSDDEIKERTTYWKDKKKFLRPFSACEYCRYCTEDCNFMIRSNADYFASRLLEIYGRKISDLDYLKRFLVTIPKLIEGSVEKYQYTLEQENRMIACIKLRFYRKYKMESDIQLTQKELRQVLRQED